MKHSFSLEGYGYRLRPVGIKDASFIIETRLEDAERNQFIHKISSDIAAQEEWIEHYLNREGDYYFVVENRFTRKEEGLIAFYNENCGRAEWGRWVIKKDSMAAVESVWLLHRIAFEKVGLNELYCRTIKDNTEVVSFHTAIGAKTRCIHKEFFTINGKKYDAVEQYSDRDHFVSEIAPTLETKAEMIGKRNFRKLVGQFEFHHIGVATNSIEKEYFSYSLLGYSREGAVFEDSNQGIRGLFIAAPNQPRLELLQNLDGCDNLDLYLRGNAKMYHKAYMVNDIEKAMEVLINCRAKVMSPLKRSVYFGKRICFLMLSNMELIELVEE